VKPLLWILVIGAALYYFVTKYTTSGAAQSGGGGGGVFGSGGIFDGLLGFGSASPAIDTSQASTANANTIQPPALGPATDPFHRVIPGPTLQPRVIGPGPITIATASPLAPIGNSAPVTISPVSPGRTSVVTAPTPPPARIYGIPHYRAYV
jgi:hypothetical protein